MRFTDRSAPEDTAIKREALDENIEVSKPGRYYPDDYSTLIKINQTEGGIKGEIPSTLAKIVEHYDDFKISTWSDEEGARIAEQRIDNQYEQKKYQEQLHLEMLNSNYDRQQKLLSDLDVAAEEAKATEGSVEDAVNLVLEDYRYPEGLSPAAQEQWQKTFSDTGLKALKQARNTDYENAFLQNKANISHIMEVGLNDIATGKCTPGEVIERDLNALKKNSSHMPPAVFKTMVSDYYSKAVLMSARKIESLFKEGQKNGPEATLELRALLEKYRDLTFTYKDEQGNEGSFSCSLSQQTQELLLHVFNDVKNGGGGSSDSNLSFSTKDWETLVGWDDFENKGYSQKIASMSVEDFDKETQSMLDNVAGSTATASKKYETAKDIAEKSAALRGQLLMKELLPIFGSDAGAALQIGLSKLQEDLYNKNVDFSNYALPITVGGKSFTAIVPSVIKDFPAFGNSSLANRLYWEKYAQGINNLSKYISGKPISTIVAQTDGDIIQAEKGLAGTFTRELLLEGEGEKTIIAPKKEVYEAMNKYVDAWGKYANINPVMSDQLIEAGINAYSNDKLSNRDQLLMQKALASVITSKNVHQNLLPSFTEYYLRTRDKRAEGIFTGLALSQPGAEKIFNQLADPTIDFESGMKKAKDDKSILDYRKNKTLYSDLGIDNRASLYFDDLETRIMSLTGNDKNAYKSFKDTMKQLVDPLFVPKQYISFTGMQSRPFIYSPQMKVYGNSQKGFENLKYTMSSSVGKVKEQYDKLGLRHQVTIYSDDAAGNFYFVIDGKRIQSTIPGMKGYNGAIMNLPETVNTPEFVGQYNAVSFLSSLASQDKGFREKLDASSVRLTPEDKEKLSKQKLSSQLLRTVKGTTDTRTIHELYGNDIKADLREQADYASIAATMSNPKTMREAFSKTGLQTYPGLSISNKSTWSENLDIGAIQDMAPRNAILKNFLYIPNENFPGAEVGMKKNASINYEIGKAVSENSKLKGGVTGYAASFEEDDFDDIFADELEASSTEMSPEAYKRMIDYVSQSSSHASKINTTDVSVPVSHAAVGDENYIDAYNSATQAGFEVNDGFVPGVTRDTFTPARDYEGPTGYAAKVTTGLDGSLSKPPTITNKEYTKNEVKDLVDYYADMFNIPPRIAHALVNQESGYNTKANSSAGAQGVCQLMKATAQNLGVQDPLDPAQNIWGGMKYLKAQFQQFGNWGLALAAYNAGPGAVNKYRGIPPYKETQKYVANILKASGFGRHGTYPVDFKLEGGNIKFLDSNTGLLSPKGVNDFVYVLQNRPGYANKINVVYTNRRELTENKPEYEAFAKYRALKTSANTPMFRYDPNVEGFSVMLKNDDIKPGFHSNATPAIADAVSAKQTQFLPENDRDSIEALINTFASRYNNPADQAGKFFTNQFGLANLTPQEYADYGVPADVSGNPELQARVLNLEFQRAIDILGSSYKAIYALAGGQVRDERGNIKTWQQVKEDKESFMRSWVIHPSEDKKQRDIANAFVESYQRYYGRLRGEL